MRNELSIICVSHCFFSWLQKHHLQISSDYISEIRVMHELVTSVGGRKGHCRKHTDQFQMRVRISDDLLSKDNSHLGGYQYPPMNSLWRDSTFPAHSRWLLLATAWCQDPSPRGWQLNSPFLWADEQQMAMCFSRTEPVAFPSQLEKLIWMKKRRFQDKAKKKSQVLIPRQHAFLNREGNVKLNINMMVTVMAGNQSNLEIPKCPSKGAIKRGLFSQI